MTAHTVMAFVAGFVVATAISIKLSRGAWQRGYVKAIGDLAEHTRTNPNRDTRLAVYPFMAEFLRRVERGDFRPRT